MSPDRSRRARSHRSTSLTRAFAPRNPTRIIHVVAEGEVTEPGYFDALNQYFGRQNEFWIDVQYSAKGLNPLAVSERAVAAARRVQDRQRRVADRSPEPLQEIWAVFDRDEHQSIGEAFACIRRHNEDSGKEGHRKVKIAFSHPSDFGPIHRAAKQSPPSERPSS